MGKKWNSISGDGRLVNTKETDKAITTSYECDRFIQTSDGEVFYHWTNKWIEKRQKFLCCGGPFQGKKMTEDAAGEEYTTFNNSATNRYPRNAEHRVIQVHISLLLYRNYHD